MAPPSPIRLGGVRSRVAPRDGGRHVAAAHVTIEFSSYQAAARAKEDGAEIDLVVVEGHDGPQPR
jgi:predicted HD phosphohydrolase